MSGVTDNYGLITVEEGEAYDEEVFNANMRTVDAKLKIAIDSVGKPLAHMGRTQGFQGPVTGAATRIVCAAAQFMFGGFTFDAANGGALVIPKTGRYNVRLKAFFSGPGGTLNQAGIWINDALPPNGPTQALTSAQNKDTGGADIFVHSSANLAFNAGDKISFWQLSTAASAWGTNGYDGSNIEIEWSGA